MNRATTSRSTTYIIWRFGSERSEIVEWYIHCELIYIAVVWQLDHLPNHENLIILNPLSSSVTPRFWTSSESTYDAGIYAHYFLSVSLVSFSGSAQRFGWYFVQYYMDLCCLLGLFQITAVTEIAAIQDALFIAQPHCAEKWLRLTYWECLCGACSAESFVLQDFENGWAEQNSYINFIRYYCLNY